MGRRSLIFVLVGLQVISFSGCNKAYENERQPLQPQQTLSKTSTERDEDVLLVAEPQQPEGEISDTDVNQQFPTSPTLDTLDAAFLSKNYSRPFPHIRVCRQSDVTQLNECLRGVLEAMRSRLALGIEELGLPGVDPLKLYHLSFQHESGPVRILSQFNEVEVTGLSLFNKSTFWVDIKNKHLDFDITFPQLLLAGSYKMSGNMLFVPISGDGNFWLNLEGVNSNGTGQLVSSMKNSGERQQRQVVLQGADLNLNINSIKGHLTNLFNGDSLLGPVVNNFLNENSQEIFQELRPQITSQLGEMLIVLANEALSAVPEDIFNDIPLSLQNNSKESTVDSTKNSNATFII